MAKVLISYGSCWMDFALPCTLFRLPSDCACKRVRVLPVFVVQCIQHIEYIGNHRKPNAINRLLTNEWRAQKRRKRLFASDICSIFPHKALKSSSKYTIVQKLHFVNRFTIDVVVIDVVQINTNYKWSFHLEPLANRFSSVFPQTTILAKYWREWRCELRRLAS